MTKIKICGLTRMEDIRMVNELKPDFCGFIIEYPKSHRSLEADRVKELTAALDRSHVIPVGVFVNAPMELVKGLLCDGTISIAQLHGDEEESDIRTLKEETGRPVIKAFTIKSAEDVKKAVNSCADYILLDQGKGQGQTFDWSLIPKIERKWFLAGGIGPENIEEAILRLKPWGVDLSSSVETDRLKDPAKTAEVIRLTREIG